MADRDWLLVLIGAIGFIVLSHQVPILRQLGSVETLSHSTIRLEDIHGIDIDSLNKVRQNGLI